MWDATTEEDLSMYFTIMQNNQPQSERAQNLH